MTTGTHQTGTPGCNGEFTYRSWAGGDGKYVIVNGNKLTKYNNYTNQAFRCFTAWPRYNGVLYSVNITRSVGFSEVFSSNYAVKNQNKLVSKVKDFDFNLAVSAVEIGQTVSMTVGAIHSIGGAILDLHKGNFAGAARRLGIRKHTSKLGYKDVTGRWLEMQYGWLPLMSDVYGASKAMEAATASPRHERVKASTLAQKSINGSSAPSLYSGWGIAKATRTIIYEMVENIPVNRQLGLSDPLTLAWEEIPYSFVADWFIPIGSYLENLNILPTLKGTFITSDHLTYDNTYGKVYPAFIGGSGSGHFESHSRTVTTSIPALKIARPGFNTLDGALSPKHVANAIALLSNFLGAPVGSPSYQRALARGSIF